MILIFILYSCGVNMGTRIDIDNLNVFFLEGVQKEKAIAFANYWKDNGFIGERKQVIQLENDNNVILVKLIERDFFYDEPITIEEEMLLQNLERDLERKVFQQGVEIVITDNTFRPIEKRNP
ncbi:MAG: hypothetical protein WC994_01345 [Brumimicrobium sp.]